jgi:hypothetical protein
MNCSIKPQIPITNNKTKNITVTNCPIVKYGSITGIPPIQPKKKPFITKINIIIFI